MTSAITAADFDVSDEVKKVAQPRKQKISKQEEVLLMAETMMSQGGLLNAAQTAIFLDISRERVYELIELGMLNKFEFLGRTYVSMNEVKARRDADVKAGRPSRGLMKRIAVGLKAAVNSDLGQLRHGTAIPDKQLERDIERRRKKLKK